ncbi:lantibiotic dehydratase [Streptomyces sp. NPDC001889]
MKPLLPERQTRPAPTPRAGTEQPAPAPRLAPGALIRTTLLSLPAETRPAGAFRAALAELTALEEELTARAPALGDALYASRAGHGAEFHREVVLPLRRAVHNGRDPRPALLGRLGDLPGRVPGLPGWLGARRRRSELLTALEAGTAPALTAGRAALAGLCREPAFTRAVAFGSADLLRAVVRAGEGRDDRGARKEEAGVLRHAMRAAARTTPLSWFTAVGWGELPPPAAGTRRPWSGAGVPLESAGAVVRVNRTLVDTLMAALLADRERRAGLPHRMCSSPRLSDGRAAFARSRTAFVSARFVSVEDDEVALAAGEPLLRLAALCAGAGGPGGLDALARALAGPGEQDAALAFLGRVCEAGLLVPVEPVGPHDPDPLTGLATWLREGTGSPGDRELAGRIDSLAADTRAFGTAEPARRTAVLTGLRERWGALLGEVGRPVGDGADRLTVLSEDVVLGEPVRLDGFLDDGDHQALAELAALTELFDLGPVVRRCVRDSFVARYGPGGVCPHVWDFGAAAHETWQRATRLIAAGDPRAEPPGSPAADGAGRLTALRSELVAAVRRDHAESGGADVVLPGGLVTDLVHRLPPWATRRPVSYSLFLQRGHGGLLCVNQVYGGWGRFSSRFLESLPPAAARGTADAVLGALAPGARVAQLRPVSGFNANLHPLFVPEEIGPDRSYASLGADDVELVHDVRDDEVRVRLKATGEPVDVLYAGVLAPLLLPPRLAPLLTDHAHGTTDFSALAPRRISAVPGGELVRTPRVRHRHLVLRRRRWELAGGSVAALRAELAAEGGVPVAAVARWRALAGLPDQVFLHAAPPPRGERVTEDFLHALDLPKPQFVDLGDALHLRSLGKWLARHPGGAVLEEALPAPGTAGAGPAVELVVETYRAGRPRVRRNDESRDRT